ncbi:MAG TPA: hypothetical protein VFH90_05195 [Candidatus Limnocylindria bacterium]|nr:hypothetical protein [Candidatus Limnocylindria bacterium]
MQRFVDWIPSIVAAVSGAYLIAVAIDWIADEGRPGYVIGSYAACFVFAIGLRWIYTRIRKRIRPGEGLGRVWSPWLVPLAVVVFWIARR